MARDALSLHALDQVRQAVAGGIKVRIVDLADVAGQHDLGALAHATHDGLHLVRRQVLRLVHDHELVRNAATADVGERFHHQLAAGHQLIHALLGGAAVGITATAAARAEQVADIVEDGLHPQRQLLILVAGQVADVAAKRHDRSRDQQLVEPLLAEHLVQTRGDRHERLAGAGGADQRDQPHLVVEQQIQGHRLLQVARHDAVHRLARTHHGNQVARVGQHARQPGVTLVAVIHQRDELVRHQFVRLDVHAFRALQDEPLELLHAELALLIQLVDGLAGATHGGVARVQPVGVHAIGLEVLARNAQRVALHARVDVLADEDGAQALLMQAMRHA